MTLLAVGQMNSTSSLSTNLTQAIGLINKAVSANAKVLFLPEASDYIARSANHSIQIAKPINESVFVLGIQKKLLDLNKLGRFLNVVVGVHEPVADKKRVQNLLIYINEQGEIIKKYQKIHLFDVNIPNGPILKESNSVEPGSKIIKPFDTPIGKLGMCICYDIRFPELAVKLRDLGADILTYPSAFTMKTGAAHWELLGRARATDSQSYVIMPAQSGVHDTSIEDIIDENTGELKVLKVEAETPQKRISYGHSMIVDPWGTVVSQASDIHQCEPTLIVADIDLCAVEKVRKDMPLKDHRRRDIFRN